MTTQTAGTRLAIPLSDHDHVLGPASVPVTLVEYGDFECPACGAAHPVVKQLLRGIGDQVRFVFRHFPLTSVHPHARRAAEAAEAAEAQGRFWEMHDLLYANQDALEDDDLVAYAAALRLDLGRFVTDLERGTFAGKVRRDFLGGARSGVNGTPTFFVNGVRHDGPSDLGGLLAEIEDALEAD